jgi:dUTPase
MNTVNYYIKQVDGMVVPLKANETDAGYDIDATSGPKIVGNCVDLVEPLYTRVDYIEYATNLYITPEGKYHTNLRPRSSISNYNLVLANSVGLIDAGYKNQILVRFKYIFQPEDIVCKDGYTYGKVNFGRIYKYTDKIAQLLPEQTLDMNFISVNELPYNDRGGGFGSTGK